jgi:hypothetical protein
LAPELDAFAGQLLVADTVGHGHETAVRNRMATLDGFPGGMLDPTNW